MKILVVEDEPKIARILSRSLMEEGYAVDMARSVPEALSLFEQRPYDLVVLDLLLPGHEDGGLEVCRHIRRHSNVPILMLTAINSVAGRVKGLDLGGDDYMAKPFELDELYARIRALLRRSPGVIPPVLEVGDLKLDPAVHTAWRSGKNLSLSAKEFQILEYFMRHKNRIVAQGELLDHIWDSEYAGMSNVVEVSIRNVRLKIGKPDLIYTVRGRGYILRESVA